MMDMQCSNPDPHQEHNIDAVVLMTCDGRTPCGKRYEDPHLIRRVIPAKCAGVSQFPLVLRAEAWGSKADPIGDSDD